MPAYPIVDVLLLKRSRQAQSDRVLDPIADGYIASLILLAGDRAQRMIVFRLIKSWGAVPVMRQGQRVTKPSIDDLRQIRG